MRIALSNPDVNLAGGVERVIAESANHLARRGHAVTVYAARVDPTALDSTVRVTRVAVPARMDLRAGVGFRRRCARAIASDRPDVHGSFSALSPLGGVFWVPSVHRVGYELLLRRRGVAGRTLVRLNPYHRVRLRMEGSMLARGGCALALAQTETVRSEIVRCYGETCRLGVLGLGYDDATFDPERRACRRDEARRRLGYSPDDAVVLFAANELERKGFETLLAAASLMPDVKVLGAGRVAPSPQLLGRFESGGRVRWMGHAGDVEMLHAAADALVLPTRYEPWGLVIVEALGSGLPVVTTRLAGAAVTVDDGRTGRLLDDPEDEQALADAIRWALSDRPASATEIAASVGDYTWTRVIERYEQALTEVAHGR